MSEILRRIDKSISEYSAALMNNTKWREVLNILGETSMPVQFAFVREEEFSSHQIKFPIGGCNETHTKDCTMHGPFSFKEIYAIKCPVVGLRANGKTGAKYKCTERSDRFLDKVKAIGIVPIEIREEFIHIKGYE